MTSVSVVTQTSRFYRRFDAGRHSRIVNTIVYGGIAAKRLASLGYHCSAPNQGSDSSTKGKLDVRRYLALIALSLLASLSAASSASALGLEEIGSFAKPLYVTSDPNDAGRLFVLEREGTIKLVESGTISTYVDFSAKVSCCEGERGAGSIAFAPDFATSHKLYVAYAAKAGAEQEEGDVVVDQLTEPEEPEGELAEFEPERVLTIPHSEAPFHNGSQLQFGPDGYLYLSVGDATRYAASQDPELPLGKILRFQPGPSGGYVAPEGNPFIGGDFAPIVWALGMRNPFRFSFDRLTGDLLIGDVGENDREEIDWAPSPGPGIAGGARANFGWSCREAGLVGPGTGLGYPACIGKDAADFDSPIAEYAHVKAGEGGAICSGSIIGGYVVRDNDPSLGELYGHYVYADFCTGEIRALRLPAAAGLSAGESCSLELSLPADRPSSFGEDAAGRIYIASLAGGVYRVVGPAFAGCPSASSSTEPSSPTVEPEPSGQAAPEAAAPRLRIKVRRLRGKPGLAWISVSPLPCAGQSKRRVILLRGGNPNGSKRIGSDCVVRFRRRARQVSTFRAKLAPLPGDAVTISRRVTIRRVPFLKRASRGKHHHRG